MALNGSLTTNKYENDRYYKLSWTATQSGNKSTIAWTLSAESVSTYDNWYAERTLKLTIGGTTVYSKTDRVERYDGVIATGKTDISHNADGSKSFTASIEAAVYGSSINITGSESFTLDPIPQYLRITKFVVAQRDETSVKIDYDADKEWDWVWYSKDNGTTWVNLTNTVITGLTPNTSYDFKIKIRRKDNQLITESSKVTQKTYDYPHCTDSPSFYIGDPLTLSFYNPLGREFTFNIIANGVQLSYDWTISGKKYEGIYAEGVQAELYNTIPNAQDGAYQVKVTYGGNVAIRDSGNRYVIKTEECRPIFNNVEYRDTNTNIVNVTGNEKVLVKGYSNLVVEIPSNDKMVAVKGATPTSYAAIIGTINCWADYSTDNVAINVGSITDSNVSKLRVVAYDSRGVTNYVDKNITVVDYKKPVIYASAQRLNNFEAQTTLKISGSFSPVIVDGVQKNYISQVWYRYRETGGAWSGYIEIAVYGKGTTEYYCNDVVISLDNGKSWEFEVLAKDSIDTNTTQTTVDVGKAIFFVSSNKKACYINGEKIIMYDVVDTWGAW